MSDTAQTQRNFDSEFVFNTSRSSGAGGQNVNKVNTKVELRFNVTASQLLSEKEKEIISQKLHNRINDHGELILVSQTERTQLKNKEEVIKKFYILINKALTPKKKRKPTKPTAASKAKRLEDKKIHSVKKANRGMSYED
ncbi:MAG TPA: alternative ribosome rescue aminoacyl-tRNA hydrolase ArfB [Bacteroidales bacterium]